MELRFFVENYNTLPVEDRKSYMSKLAKGHGVKSLYSLAKGKNARKATRIMADMGTRISEFVQQHKNDTLSFLASEDPKVRMHAAQIIGNTCASECVEELILALEKEQTMFALPSLILALGNSKTVRAKEYLEAYTLKSDLDKHLDEEKTALSKALAHYVSKKKATVRILPTDVIFVTTPNANATFASLQHEGFKTKQFGDYIAVSGLSDFNDIYASRAFCNAYIYLGKCDISQLPGFLASREKAILQRTATNGYRLEVKSVPHEIRLDIIRKCIAACKVLINSPSSYSIEIVIDINGTEAQVFLNPLVDKRFSYRKKTVPASINAGVAACVCEYASEFFHEDARVLDNFCGSGTMLFERSYYPHHTLTGVDIDIGAIEAAKENSRFSNVHPQFHYMDALKFTAKKYDEIITNMPFGLRVGSHTHNERLYKSYFSILPRILTSGGYAILYTHEKHLTEYLLKQNTCFEMLKRATFSAGGLYPAVYVLQKTT